MRIVETISRGQNGGDNLIDAEEAHGTHDTFNCNPASKQEDELSIKRAQCDKLLKIFVAHTHSTNHTILHDLTSDQKPELDDYEYDLHCECTDDFNQSD